MLGAYFQEEHPLSRPPLYVANDPRKILAQLEQTGCASKQKLFLNSAGEIMEVWMTTKGTLQVPLYSMHTSPWVILPSTVRVLK